MIYAMNRDEEIIQGLYLKRQQSQDRPTNPEQA